MSLFLPVELFLVEKDPDIFSQDGTHDLGIGRQPFGKNAVFILGSTTLLNTMINYIDHQELPIYKVVDNYPFSVYTINTYMEIVIG